MFDESVLYPGSSSEKGFLAKGESLQEVIDKDAATLKELRVTHKQIADRLEYVMGRACRLHNERMFKKQALDYYEELHKGIEVDGIKVTWVSWMGDQDCPWECKDEDGYTKSNTDFTMSRDGVVITPSGLLVHLIRNHQFFEGRTKYRLDPADAVKVLGIIPEVDYTPFYYYEQIWTMSSGYSGQEKEVDKIILTDLTGKYHQKEKEIYDKGEPIILEGHPDIVVRVLDDRMLTISGGFLEAKGPFVIKGLRLNSISAGLCAYRKAEVRYVK